METVPAAGEGANPLRAVIADPIPARAAKPRCAALTMVIDKGLGPAATADLLAVAADSIDFVKLAFGTAVLYPPDVLARKIRDIRAAGVEVYPGGTLLEAAVYQGAAREFLSCARQLGFTYIEVSSGTIDLAPTTRRDLIRRARDMGFGVLTEVGRKDPARPLVPQELAEQAEADREDGAFKVIVEGRDAGRSVGIYDDAGRIRDEVLEAIVAALPDPDAIIWEAPQPQQQAALLVRLGSAASFGNVQPGDVVTLEAMRRGLRGDTLRRCLTGPASQG